jgi:predicted transcriptional regulator of viral defense system
VWRNNRAILVADPHRTVIDVLDWPELGGGGRHSMDIAYAYWKSGKSNPDALMGYASKLNRGVVFKRLGFTAENWGAVDKTWIAECRKHISAGVSKLDPSGPDRGHIVTRWSLRINVPMEEYG